MSGTDLLAQPPGNAPNGPVRQKFPLAIPSFYDPPSRWVNHSNGRYGNEPSKVCRADIPIRRVYEVCRATAMLLGQPSEAIPEKDLCYS